MSFAAPTFLSPAGILWCDTPEERDRLGYLEHAILGGVCPETILAEYRELRDAHRTWYSATHGYPMQDETIRAMIAARSPAGLREHRRTLIEQAYANTLRQLRTRHITTDASWAEHAGAVGHANHARIAALAAIDQECSFGSRFITSSYAILLELPIL
jgi:hypothetical protein